MSNSQANKVKDNPGVSEQKISHNQIEKEQVEGGKKTKTKGLDPMLSRRQSSS
jgi:hypothetical protein